MVQMISGPDALAMMQSYDVAVVDVRNPEQYAARHFMQDGIEAINARTEEQLLSLPKKRILIYCTCAHDGLAIRGARFLFGHGYEWVWAVQGGLDSLLGKQEDNADIWLLEPERTPVIYTRPPRLQDLYNPLDVPPGKKSHVL